MPTVGDGAAWIYTRSGATWSQQGGKLVGSGVILMAWKRRGAGLFGRNLA